MISNRERARLARPLPRDNTSSVESYSMHVLVVVARATQPTADNLSSSSNSLPASSFAAAVASSATARRAESGHNSKGVPSVTATSVRTAW
eukprot:scaffold5442_cov34-Tisochrysis_lutea.AAC.4